MEELIEKIVESAIDLFFYLWTREYAWMEKEIFGTSGVEILAFIVLIVVLKLAFQAIVVRINRALGIDSRRR